MMRQPLKPFSFGAPYNLNPTTKEYSRPEDAFDYQAHFNYRYDKLELQGLDVARLQRYINERKVSSKSRVLSVCECICVCVCVCVCARARAPSRVCASVFVSPLLCGAVHGMSVCVCVYVRARMYVTCASMSVCMCVCVFMYMHVCVTVCVCLYVCVCVSDLLELHALSVKQKEKRKEITSGHASNRKID